MDELYTTLNEVIYNIDTIMELFYTQKEPQGYVKLRETIDDISRVMEMLLGEAENGQMPDNYMEIINYLQEALLAVEARDTILLADILQYEIKGRFEAILDEMK